MLVNVLSREEDAFPVLRRLTMDNHEDRRSQLRLARPRGPAHQEPAGVRRTDPARRGRRLRPALRPDRGAAGGLRAQPAAVPLRARGARRAGPGVRDVHPRRGVGDRGGAGGATAAAVRPAARRARRGDRGAQGRGRGVRRADGPDRGRDLAPAARRAARAALRDLPGAAPVALARRARAEVGRAGDVGAGDGLHGPGRSLPGRPVRGPGAALPDRRLPGAAADGAGVPSHRGARAARGLAGGDGAPGRLLAARRVGGAVRPRPRVRARCWTTPRHRRPARSASRAGCST